MMSFPFVPLDSKKLLADKSFLDIIKLWSRLYIFNLYKKIIMSSYLI